MIYNIYLTKALILQKAEQCYARLLHKRITFLKVRIAIVMLGFSCLANGQTLSFETWNMSTTGGLFSVNNFTCVSVDKFGNVWAGTTGGGLYMYANGNWVKAIATYPDLSYRDIVCALDGSVWAASIGKNGLQAEQGGVFYINSLTADTIRYGSGLQGGLSSRLVNSLTIRSGFIHAAVGRSLSGTTTNEGGVFKLGIANPPPPTASAFLPLITDAGTGINYTSSTLRNKELWFAKGSFCSGSCIAPKIVRQEIGKSHNDITQNNVGSPGTELEFAL